MENEKKTDIHSHINTLIDQCVNAQVCVFCTPFYQKYINKIVDKQKNPEEMEK